MKLRCTPAHPPRQPKAKKFEFGASNGLVWGQTIRQSTQLDELRRSRKVSASEDTILKSYGHLKLVPIFSWFSLAPPGGWCSSGAVRFEKSSVCLRNVTNLRKKRSQGDSGIFSRAKKVFFQGKNFFFQGQKLFFSGASKTSTKRTHPRGPKPEKRSGHARKSAKIFFFTGPNFFFEGP